MVEKKVNEKYLVFINFPLIYKVAISIQNENKLENTFHNELEDIILTFLIEITWHGESNLLIKYVLIKSYFFTPPMKEIKALGYSNEI